jgi:hypothetical protein
MMTMRSWALQVPRLSTRSFAVFAAQDDGGVIREARNSLPSRWFPVMIRGG